MSDQQHRYFFDSQAAVTHFLNRTTALHTATTLQPYVYYSGEPLGELDAQLIHVPFDRFTAFFSQHLGYPLPHIMVLPDHFHADEAQQIQDAFALTIQDLQQFRQHHVGDAWFTDPVMAWYAAAEQNPYFYFNPRIPHTQTCYYLGAPVDEAPHNLVALDITQAVQQLALSGKRLPTVVYAPVNVNGDTLQAFEQEIHTVLKQAKYLQHQSLQQLVFESRQQAPRPFTPDTTEKPVVYVHTSRYTTVMQYASRGLAEAFGKLGYQVYFSMEKDGVDYHPLFSTVDEHLSINPNIVININHLNNEWLHPDVHNIVWYQDAMPDLKAQQPLDLRQNDHIFAFETHQVELLQGCGVETIHYQDQCIDTSIYRLPDENTPRKQRVVFVGSAYLDEKVAFENSISVEKLATIRQFLLDVLHDPNRHINGHETDALAQAHQVDADLLRRYWIYLLRWHCLSATIDFIESQSSLTLALYGYGWGNDPLTAPYDQGVIENGQPLAKLYQTSAYALSLQPYMIGHQRLAEIAACGAIPLVFNSENPYEQVDYRDEMIGFDSPDHIGALLNQTPPKLSNQKISQRFDYVTMAKRIEQLIYPQTLGSLEKPLNVQNSRRTERRNRRCPERSRRE